MAQFYASLGPKKAQGTRMAVMDMSAAFEKATQTHAPMAVIGVGKVAGFSLHAGVVTWADQREKLERLRRYVSRPAVSEKRPSLTPHGNVWYQLKTPYRDGTTHVISEPLDLIARALLPKPRANLP